MLPCIVVCNESGLLKCRDMLREKNGAVNGN